MSKRTFRLSDSRPDPTRDVDDELAFHLEMRTREFIDQGMSPEEARQRAAASFGDVQSIRTDLRQDRADRNQERERRDWWQGARMDVQYAIRSLRKNPAFSLASIATLALGIGATTAVFTVVNGVLLRPLPYADPERLLLLLNGRNGRLSTSFSPPNYRDVTTQSGAFTGAAAFDASNMNLTGLGEPQRLQGANVTGAFFQVLGVKPTVGRTIEDADVAGERPVIVLSDGFWRRQFGGRIDVVGTILRLDGKPFEIVGVAPPELTFPGTPAFWRPLILTPHNWSDSQRGAQWIGAIARLKPDLT